MQWRSGQGELSTWCLFRWLLPCFKYTLFLINFQYRLYFFQFCFFSSHFLALCRADGRQPQPKTSAPRPAVHAGSELRPLFYSLVPHSSLGASSQPQTTPPLHAGAMPHATSQQKKVKPVKQTQSLIIYSWVFCVNSLHVRLFEDQQHNEKIVEEVLPSYTDKLYLRDTDFPWSRNGSVGGAERLKWACCSLKITRKTSMNNIYRQKDIDSKDTTTTDKSCLTSIEGSIQ